MASDHASSLAEAVTARADDKHLACSDAFKIAADLDVTVASVGRACDELGIKIVQCQLGCF